MTELEQFKEYFDKCFDSYQYELEQRFNQLDIKLQELANSINQTL